MILLVILLSLFFLLLLLFWLAYVAVQGRVLELLVLLDEHWQKHRLGGYKLVLLHNTAFNTGEFAKSQVGDLKSFLFRLLRTLHPSRKTRAGFLVRKIETRLEEAVDVVRRFCRGWNSRRFLDWALSTVRRRRFESPPVDHAPPPSGRVTFFFYVYSNIEVARWNLVPMVVTVMERNPTCNTD